METKESRQSAGAIPPSLTVYKLCSQHQVERKSKLGGSSPLWDIFMVISVDFLVDCNLTTTSALLSCSLYLSCGCHHYIKVSMLSLQSLCSEAVHVFQEFAEVPHYTAVKGPLYALRDSRPAHNGVCTCCLSIKMSNSIFDLFSYFRCRWLYKSNVYFNNSTQETKLPHGEAWQTFHILNIYVLILD